MVLPTHIVAAGGIVTNEKDEILLIKNPLKGWEYPGGIVEPGETVPQGVIREIREETGVGAQVLAIVGVYSNTQPQEGYNGVLTIPTIVTIDFLLRYVSGALATSPESEEVGWFSKEEALLKVKRKQLFRLERALACRPGIACMGYKVNSADEIEIHEEYLFDKSAL